MMLIIVLLVVSSCVGIVLSVDVAVTSRSPTPSLSFIDGTSKYSFVFNPTWVVPSDGTNGRGGLISRTQDCPAEVGGECVFCSGSAEKASILTFAEAQDVLARKFSSIDDTSVVFGPTDESDTWGTEDPRVQYNADDQLYYMFYTGAKLLYVS